MIKYRTGVCWHAVLEDMAPASAWLLARTGLLQLMVKGRWTRESCARGARPLAACLVTGKPIPAEGENSL